MISSHSHSPVESTLPISLEKQSVELLYLADISEWLDWMRQEMPLGGVDLPNEDTSVLFSAKAVHLAHRLEPLCYHLPTQIRTLLIQASILHQCWNRQRSLRETVHTNAPHSGELETNYGKKFIRRVGGDSLIEADDGQQYIVKFPSSDRETALATEIIAIRLAKLMGLPTPNASVILVDRELARATGIGRSGWQHYVSNGTSISCLGLCAARSLRMEEDDHPKIRLSRKGVQYSAGMLVFNILLLNSLQEEPFFRIVKGRAEPTFLYHSRCMMDGNWSRFVRASYTEWVVLPSLLACRIKSMDQLAPWLIRAKNVDLNHIWKLVFTLPPAWYGERRILLTGILRKLETRMWKLEDSVRYLVQQGHFPSIRK
jgi:hypothetical protein